MYRVLTRVKVTEPVRPTLRIAKPVGDAVISATVNGNGGLGIETYRIGAGSDTYSRGPRRGARGR